MSLNLSDPSGQREQALSQNPSFAFAHTKAERLSTAIHLVTRFMDGDEPLRRNLRSESLKLLSRIFILEEGGGDSITAIISRTISLLDIAYRTQYISEMNWSVIREEYLSLGRFIEERNPGATFDTNALTKSFFATPKPAELPRERGKTVASGIKDKIISKRQNSTSRVKSRKSESPIIRERKNGRRTAILKLIKERKKVGVRDVAEVITGVSEKTLQRELISLVEEGILKKEGERRWSTYSMA